MSEKIIAQYTIRAKQEYIFKTNKILEIVGGSINIRRAWDKLFAQADDLKMNYLRISDSEEFCLEEIEDKFDNENLCMVELFCGGGNETVLFKDVDTYKELNRHFTHKILKENPGMIPMMVYTKVTGNYQEDYKRLMKVAELEKNKMISGQEYFILPFSMIDKETFKPYTREEERGDEKKRYSEEAYAKYVAGIQESNKDSSVKLLDSMVTSKGDESLLAVVHADGNNMGTKIMDMLSGHEDYNYCIDKMRKFTFDTAIAFGTNGLKALERKREELEKKYEKIDKSSFAYRVIINDGDDMTFVCNARFVMEYVTAYIKAVQNYKSKWQYSSCAGVCIFHSHYPFAKAYSLAEQACDDGAKQKVHRVDEEGKPLVIEEGWVDFHFIHSGIGGNLKEIRNRQNTMNCMARPWCVSGKMDEYWDFAKLQKIRDIIDNQRISRTNIKGIGIAVEDGLEEGRKELKRIYGHNRNLKQNFEKIFNNEDDLLKALYDFAEVYDLWYRGDR